MGGGAQKGAKACCQEGQERKDIQEARLQRSGEVFRLGRHGFSDVDVAEKLSEVLVTLVSTPNAEWSLEPLEKPSESQAANLASWLHTNGQAAVEK